MKKFVICLLLAMPLTLGACAPTSNSWDIKKPVPNPSAVVAAEIALRRAIENDGHAKALRDAAADDAILVFDDRTVSARDWLWSNDSTQVVPENWTTTKVYMSCDGQMAAATGIWTGRDGQTRGMYTHIWKRGEVRRGKDPDWKWVVLYNQPSTNGLDEDDSDFVRSQVAECPAGKVSVPASPPPSGYTYMADGKSPDETLVWALGAIAGKGTMLSVYSYDGNSRMQVINMKDYTDTP